MFKRRKAKRSDKGKIYKTTDGYFSDKEQIKKPRRVAVVHQRKDDGAVAVVKIYSKKEKRGKAYIEELTLKPEKHPSLTEDSIVGNKILTGRKLKNGGYRAFFTKDFKSENDSLSNRELRKVKRKISRDSPQHRKTYRKTVRKWKKHYKDKK